MRGIAGSDLVGRDELVHVVETLVVAGVHHHGAVVGDVDGGALVFEPAECGVFHRHRRRVPGVDLDDVAEAVHLVGGGPQIEARVERLPSVFRGFGQHAVALGLVRVGERGAFGRTEVGVEVLLTGKDGPPGCYTAGTVGEGAQHGPAGGVGDGLDGVGAGGRAVQDERGVGGDAAVVAAQHGSQSALRAAFHLDDREPQRGDLHVELLAGRGVGVVAGEHELWAVVFVVDHEQEAVGPSGDGQQRSEIVVETELLTLRGAGLPGDVEHRCAGQHRVAPADHHALLVAVRDHHRVFGVDRDAVEAHPRGGIGRGGRGDGSLRGGGLFAGTAGGQHRPCADRQHRDTTDAQRRSARHRRHDIAEVLVVAGVGRRPGTGVPAPVAAGDVLARRPSPVRDKEIQRCKRHGEKLRGSDEQQASRR